MTNPVAARSAAPDSHDPGWPALWAQVGAQLQRLQAHPARSVVLLPFFQLQTVAKAAARLHWPSGFAPRLETTQSWSLRISHYQPGDLDISFDAGLDSLRARSWLQRAGLAAKQGLLGGALVQTAHQLGAVVAAVPPAQRADWAARARQQVLQSYAQGTELGGPEPAGPHALMYEAVLARIALEWAVASRYASDVLFEPALRSQLDALVVVQGLQANPLAQALAAHWADISGTASWAAPTAASHISTQACADPHSEAERAAACVLQHMAQGRVPVALAAVDRVSTRRISATLQLHGVALLDETGWKLSTTRAAASVMALLRAARWTPEGEGADDALLDWLKHTQAPNAAVDALERAFRKPNSTPGHKGIAQAAIEFIATVEPDEHPDTPVAVTADTLLASLRERRPIGAWLTSLQQALRSSGQWAALMADDAGRDCVQALHLLQPDALASHSHKLTLAELTAWVTDCLENASYKPSATDRPGPAQVVVLPLAQVLARPFAALVVAGADELRLPASPEPTGHWSAAQRAALGLPSRAALQAEQHAVWAAAMRLPVVDVLWRTCEGEQALQPSPLLQRYRLAQAALGQAVAHSADPRLPRWVPAAPTVPPQPTAGALRVASLSASSYSDLRTCPYRFFALRLLGLQDAPELDSEVDKSDFGSWLHSVLSDFHTRRKALPQPPTTHADLVLIDQCAAAQRPQGSGFIPFAATWPQVRASYLRWLAEHELEGWQFNQAELQVNRQHGSTPLVGRLDRVDRLAGSSPLAGTAYVLDYKTESEKTSKERVKNPLEDTQLAFYAALLNEDELHAAYVNVAEKDCKTTQQADIMAARDALLAGITHDVQGIHAGQAMPALGEGKACDYCDARGLCRKDMWTL